MTKDRMDELAAKVPKKQEKPSTPKPRTGMTRGTIDLPESLVIAADRLLLDLREASGVLISRNALLRATLSAIIESGLDIQDCESEEAIKAKVLSKLRK